MERALPGNAAREIAGKVLTRVVLAPCFLSLSFGSLALVRQRDVADAVRSSVWPAWKTGTLFWPAISVAQYLSFVASRNPGRRDTKN